MTLEQLNRLAENYGAIAVVLVIIVAIIMMVKKAWPGLTQAVHFVDAMVAVPTKFAAIDERLAAIESKVHTIDHEMKPNSGKSMKDQANRNQQDVERIKQALGISEN